jgi:hypothetical protein
VGSDHPVFPSPIPVVRRTLVKTSSWKSSDKDQSTRRKQERTGPHPLSVANQPSERDALVQDAANSGSLAIINPLEDIPGLGRLLFLSEEDQDRDFPQKRCQRHMAGWLAHTFTIGLSEDS